MTNGSNYYVLAEKISSIDPNNEHDVNIHEPMGGNVSVSDKTPETDDKVTITPKPDDGKEVDKVIVKDENGNGIPVKDNGDGTYTYEQPNGNVTIEVTFKDKDQSVPPTGAPQTGDTGNLLLCWLLLIVLTACFIAICIEQRKHKTVK